MSNALTIYRNDTGLYECTVKNGTGGVFNLTGASVRFTVRDGPDGTIIGTKTTASGISVTNGTLGILQVSIGSNELTTNGIYEYDIEVNQGGNVYTVVKDTLTVKRDVSY